MSCCSSFNFPVEHHSNLYYWWQRQKIKLTYCWRRLAFQWRYFWMTPEEKENLRKLNEAINHIRMIVPGEIAHEICNVQPMNGPIGQIFTMKMKYGN